MPSEPVTAADGSGPADHQKALEALDQLGEGGGEGDDDIDLGLDDEDGYGEELDDAYEDDDGGDYDAEGYFDNGDDDDEVGSGRYNSSTPYQRQPQLLPFLSLFLAPFLLNLNIRDLQYHSAACSSQRSMYVSSSPFFLSRKHTNQNT